MGFLEFLMNLDVEIQCAKTRAFVAKEEFKNKIEDNTLEDWATDIKWGLEGVKREIGLKIYEFGVHSQYLSEELSGKTMIEDNNAKIAYINKLNDEMQKMHDGAKKLTEETKKNFEISNNRLYENRKTVYRTTLKDFATTISSMKEVDFGEFAGRKLAINGIENQIMSFKPCFAGKTEEFTSLNNLLVFAVAGGLGVMIGAAWKSIELDEKMAEAEEQHAKLKAQCEQNKKDCVKIKNVTKMCDSANETISTLNELTKRIISEVKEVIEKSGNNYQKYTNDQRDKVMLMIDFSMVLNDLICTDIYDEKGAKNRAFTKIFNEAKELIQQGAHNGF